MLSRSLTLHLLFATVLSLSVLVAGLLFFVHMQNAQAVKAERKMVAGELAALKEHAKRVAVEYGWWDTAGARAEARDFDWLYENLASSIATTKIFDLVTLVPARTPQFGWTAETLEDDAPGPILSDAELSYLRAEIQSDIQRGLFVTSRFIDFDEKPMLVTATILADPADRALLQLQGAPMVVFGHRLGESFAASLAEKYLLKASAIQSQPDAGAAALELSDETGRSAGFLVWDPSRPGHQTAKAAAGPLIAFVIVFLAIMAWINKRSQLMAVRLLDSEREAKAAARTDRLTGLDNRLGFNEYTDSPFCRSKAQSGELAIIFVDLNGFKAINDNAGHASGDGVLKEVASRFQAALPRGARLARIGGDEFACVLAGGHLKSKTQHIAADLCAALETPIVLDGSEFAVGAAVGFAVADQATATTVQDLVHRADLAMYKAKQDTLLQPLEFYSELEADQHRRRELMDDLQTGFETGEIYVEYQPIVCAKTSDVVSLEALARWKSEKHGQVPPAQFIQIAEEFGFIHDLGYFVLQSACEAITQAGHSPIAINLSPIQLQDPDICEKFLAILDKAGVSPDLIEIELTERVLISNPTLAKARLQDLSEAGFAISLDDYGTGFSSLAYLKEFPFNKVKIDRQFVAECGHDDAKNQILQSLSLLAGAHDLSVVAEGVETRQQADFLRLMGYDLLQGFYFAKPMEHGLLPSDAAPPSPVDQASRASA